MQFVHCVHYNQNQAVVTSSTCTDNSMHSCNKNVEVYCMASSATSVSLPLICWILVVVSVTMPSSAVLVTDFSVTTVVLDIVLFVTVVDDDSSLKSTLLHRIAKAAL